MGVPPIFCRQSQYDVIFYCCGFLPKDEPLDIAEILRAKKLRVTPQREAIAQMLRSEGHLSVDALYALLKETHPAISLATVYKNIKDMVEKGVLMEVSLPNEKSHFELSKESHVHTYCRSCGKIIDIEINPLYLARDIPPLLEGDFSADSAQLTFYGTCSQCKK
jgi:Fur family peroxide stress response transcriptional regulator